MDNTIYILFSCNEWKEYSSMKLVMATTDEELLHEQIRNEIRAADMEFDGLTGDEGVTAFDESEQAIDRVAYGFVYSVEDGEVL